jgi:hypothetical protein
MFDQITIGPIRQSKHSDETARTKLAKSTILSDKVKSLFAILGFGPFIFEPFHTLSKRPALIEGVAEGIPYGDVMRAAERHLHLLSEATSSQPDLE